MFEGVVASLLNKYLGKYIQDLDSENLNVGIFSGDVELYDLRLKPEALAELNLPIEVKAGFVGKLTLTIPWTQLYTAPVIVAVEELFVLAGPTTDREYDEAKEKQLARAHKRVILDRLEVLPTEERDPTFLEKLAATVINNLQIFIRNIHIRYEDTVTERKSPLAVGITLHNLSAETTNSKWKITQIESEATSIYKILKLEELTMYWMPLVAHDQLLSTVTDVTYWRELMRQSLVTHAFEGEKFDFVLKPLSAVAKVIMNKSEDTNVPKLLVDFVVPDMSLSIGRQQFLSLVSVLESFQMIEVNRQFRQYRPNVPPPHNSAKWWHYAYNSIVNEYIRPYSWERIRQHRARYRQYKELYKQRLHRLKDTELLVDLQREEDQLDVPNILMAREQAKLEMSRTSPHRVRRVPPKPAASSWFGGGAEEEEEEEGEGGEVYVPAEVESAALWSKLSPEEKQVLCTAIGYAGDCDAAAAVRGARPAQYIEHKVNLTVANCTVALLNRGKDILVLSWCNLLCSLENRPAADAYRISARTESFLVEGASIEHDLVPVLTADNTVGTKGNRAPHVFSLDLEAKPTHVQADFAVSLLLEPVELVYHEHAMSELVGFLQLPTLALSEVRETAAGIAKEAVHYTKAGLLYAIETHKTVHFSVDIKSPYLVIPEYGTLQRGGTVLVIDIGRLRLDSHLQPKNASLEDATMTEIEERLYDKFSLSLSGLQVLFAYPGADWHSAQLEQESEMHIIPSLILQMNLFNSIKQDVTAMPKQKLFVTVPALKLNVSDEKLLLLLEFLRNIPLPSLSGYEDLDLTEVDAPLREIREPSVLLKKNTDMKYQPTLQQLRKMRTAVHCNSVASGRDQLDRARRRMPEDSGELFFSSSDVSEDEEDIGAKGHAIVDESATSSNAVQRLLRFVLGEFVVHVSRSVAHADKPYLMLRADRLRSDVALMAYGVAVHASLGGVQLVDKINTGSSGEYLEMASSRGSDGELISVVYRQVRTDCPDLKDAYNNTLRHLAVRFNSLSVVVDKTASMYLRRFIRGLKKKVFEEKKELPITSPAVPQPSELLKLKNVSSAIVQLSANIHLADVDMKLCDQKTEYAQVRLAGFEAGISLKKARTSVHLSLAGLTVNCCQPGSLYPDILTMEENSIFDFKYVSYHSRDVITRNRPIPVDHKLDVKVGRVRAIYLHRFTVELMNFFEPFLTKEDVTSAVVNVEQTAARQVTAMQREGTRVELNISMHAPTLLLPHSSNSTGLLLLRLGNIAARNFIKEAYVLTSLTRPVVDDIDLQLDSLEIARGVLNFAGSVEVVHTILEPIMFVVNMKHGLPPYHPQVLRWDVSGKLDLIKISLHHDDLKTLLAIQAENFAEGSNNNRVMSPSLRPSKKLKRDDIVQPSNMISEVITDDTEEEQEVYQLTNVKLSLEGIDITLVENSGDLINLEPASDFGQSLAQLVVDKFVMSAANFSDSSAEVKCTLEAISLLDVRPQETIVIRKIFSSHSGNMKFDSEMINVTCPPMIDLTFKQSKDKDMVFDLVMERMRCNISVPYLLAIATFFQKAQLPASTPAAVITPAPKSSLAGVSMAQKYFSYYPEEGGGSLAVFCNLKKSEMVLFANPDESHSKILVMRMELMVDYSNKATQDNLVASIGGLELLCCNYASRCPGYTVLEPCQIELTRCILSETSGVEMNVSLSAVNFHLSMTTITIVTDVLACLNSGKEKFPSSPKPLTATVFNSNKESTMWAVSDASRERWLKEMEESKVSTRPGVYRHASHKEVCNIKMKQLNAAIELESWNGHIPVLCAKGALEAVINDWSRQLCSTAELQLIVSYFNEKQGVWEPLIEPVLERESVYRPYELLVKAFRAESYAIGTAGAEMPSVAHDEFDGEMKKTATGHAKSMSDSSEHDESPSESEMTVIRRRFASSSVRKHRLETKASFASQHGDSSDSDADGGNIFEKIIGSFGHMFSSDSSGGEASESETEAGSKTTEGQPRDEAGEAIDETKPVFLKKGEASIEEDDKDEIDASMAAVDMATYFLVDSRDSLQLNVTPTLILLLQELLEALSERPDAEVKSNKKPPSLTVLNKLGVETDVQVRGDEETAGDVCVLQGTEYDNAPDLMDLNPETELIKAEEAEEKVDYGLDSEDPSYYDYMSNLSSAAMVSHAFSFDSDDVQPFASCSTRKVALRVNGFEAVDWQLPRRAGTHMLVMSPKQGDILYSVLATLDVTHGNRTVTLRSPLQVHNCTSYAVNVYCKVSELANHQRPAGLDEGSVGEYGLLTMLAPGQLYDVPLYVAYHCSLYMKPAHLDYEMSYNGIWWSDLAGAKDRSTYLACLATQWENRNFLIKVVCNDGVTVRLPGNLGKQVPNYMLKLHAPVVLHNYLPHHLRYSLEAKAYKDNVKCEFDVDLDAGQTKALHNIDMLSAESHQLYLEAPNYLNMHWTGVLDLSTSMDEMRGVNMTPEFEADTGTSKQFTIGVHTINTGGLEIYLYAPYWLVNKTSLPLQFRGSGSEVVYENLTSHDPLLFRFKKHRRKKVKVRVYNSRWSHSFSLDTVGSTGMVICADRERERKYRFLVQIQLSKLNLTKIVTILPFFLIVNNTPTPLRYMEHNENADLWMDIAPSQCCPFWPDTDSMRMYVAQHQSLACSQGFVVNQQHSTVLRMSSGGALRVDVSGGTESPMTVSFAPYQHGDAPILIQNVCDDIFIRFNQKCQGQVTLLKPNQQVLYTWDDPASERTIIWNVYNRKKPGYPAFVNKDGHGEVRMHIQSVKFRAPNGSVSKEPVMSSSTDEDDSEQEVIPLSELRKKMRTDKVIVYWVSFLDGPQRVLLLTQDERVAREARRLCESEKSNWELFLSLGNVSVSLINSSYEEVALLSCIGSSAKWQVEINGKWKTLNVELSLWLEDKWRAYQSSAELKDYIEVDFSRMQMVKPFFGQLCRTYSPAVFFTCRKSEHQTCIGATLHRLQIDNQLNDAVFTTVLSPILNKQYVAKQGGSGPFLEFTMLSRKLPENNGMSVQYLKALVKDFSLKLDKGFLLSVWHIFSPWQTPKSETLQLQSDLNDIHAQLKDVASQQVAAQKPCIVFEYVHLSPLKFEVSLSLRGTVHQEQGESDGLVSSHVDFFLGSVGATILDIKDVEMKLAFYERRGVVVGGGQLARDARAHYASQLIQQAYVLVLGLDILGNPYGLVRDFTQGFGDFFYEPALASIQGPEAFTESLSQGVQSLMGHVVGGTFGSAALITGSLGNTLALLSMDEDYKRKRRLRIQSMGTRGAPEAVIMAGRGFVMGVALGLSGIATKPIKGMQDEGIEGFFKGVGKGIMGLITKPAGGVIDIVAMAFEGVKRAAELGEDVIYRARIPRFINKNIGLQPYSPYQAVGQRMLRELCRGQYTESDVYFAHAPLSKQERPDVLLITDRHVFLLEKCRFWGTWDIDWFVNLEDIIDISGIVKDKLIFKVKQDNNLNPFSGEDRFIVSQDSQILHWVLQQLESALLTYRNTKEVWM